MGIAARQPSLAWRASSGGFTLLELMLVLLLMGLMLGLAGPAINSGSAGLEAKAAARQISAGLRQARATAVGRRQEATLTLDMAAHRFSVSGDDKAYSLPPSIPLKLFTAASEIDDEHVGRIRFFADGTSTGGRVTLGEGDGAQQVDVDWLTGRVKVL